jgi:hypothetical protein
VPAPISSVPLRAQARKQRDLAAGDRDDYRHARKLPIAATEEEEAFFVPELPRED